MALDPWTHSSAHRIRDSWHQTHAYSVLHDLRETLSHNIHWRHHHEWPPVVRAGPGDGGRAERKHRDRIGSLAEEQLAPGQQQQARERDEAARTAWEDRKRVSAVVEYEEIGLLDQQGCEKKRQSPHAWRVGRGIDDVPPTNRRHSSASIYNHHERCLPPPVPVGPAHASATQHNQHNPGIFCTAHKEERWTSPDPPREGRKHGWTDEDDVVFPNAGVVDWTKREDGEPESGDEEDEDEEGPTNEKEHIPRRPQGPSRFLMALKHRQDSETDMSSCYSSSTSLATADEELDETDDGSEFSDGYGSDDGYQDGIVVRPLRLPARSDTPGQRQQMQSPSPPKIRVKPKPNPPGPPRPLALSSSSVTKRALLVGIGYFASLPNRSTRPGSAAMRHVEGAGQLKTMLISRFGYAPCNVRVMTDLPRSRDVPTAANLASAMAWLAHGVRRGDRLFFAFGGHGKLEDDQSVVMPSDHKTAGTFSGAVLNALLVQSLPPGARLTALMLSCHSGSILGLPHSYPGDGGPELHLDPASPPPPSLFSLSRSSSLSRSMSLSRSSSLSSAAAPPNDMKSSSSLSSPPPSLGPVVVQFSASRNEEKAWAMVLRGTDGTARRVHMSIALYAFITSLRGTGPQSYRQLLQSMQTKINSLIDQAYRRQERLQVAYERGERARPPQIRKVRPSVPQLSSSCPLDVSSKVKL